MCSLVKQILFVDLGVSKIFNLAPCCNLTMMMESVFSFLPSYFSIIFLAKGKISKSASLLLWQIGPKQFWPINLQDFKSNKSLEQTNEIAYFLKCWYQKFKVDKNYWVGVVRNDCGRPDYKVDGWMNEWTELIVHADINSGKLKISLINFGWLWSKMGMGL